MYLSSLALQNFRSYKKAIFEFSQEKTIIVGPNTAGKTNILEAIFLLATGKSFRAEKDLELVNFDGEVGRISGKSIDSEEKKLEVVLTRGVWAGQKVQVKKYLINNIAKRQMDFAGTVKAVLFSPTDLELITDSPSLRRKYLDFVLIQVDREYRRALSSYEKGIRQRNRLLERIRDEGIPRSQLSFWDGLLIKNGNVITTKRKEFINFINYQEKKYGDFEIQYDFSEISVDRLFKYAREEVAAATTLVGPHRDDWKICQKSKVKSQKYINNNEDFVSIASFGSRGEQRMAVLWLKISELSYILEKTGEKPILLLDDIFSELDVEHRKHILEVISQQQTIITTTDLDHVEKYLLAKMRVIELR